MDETLPLFTRVFNKHTVSMSIARALFSVINEEFGVRSMDKSDFEQLVSLLEQCSKPECFSNSTSVGGMVCDDVTKLYKRICQIAFERGIEYADIRFPGYGIIEGEATASFEVPYWLQLTMDGMPYVCIEHIDEVCKRLRQTGCSHDLIRVAEICMGDLPSTNDIAEYAVSKLIDVVRETMQATVSQTLTQIYASFGYLLDDWSGFPASKGTLNMSWGNGDYDLNRYKHVVVHPDAIILERERERIHEANFAVFREFQERRMECKLIVAHVVRAHSNASRSPRLVLRNGTGSSRAMMLRKEMCVMEEALKVLWTMSGFGVMSSIVHNKPDVRSMASILSLHERSISCIYGLASVLREILMDEFPSLRRERTWNRNMSCRYGTNGENAQMCDSLLRKLSPTTLRRKEILKSALSNVSPDRCMD